MRALRLHQRLNQALNNFENEPRSAGIAILVSPHLCSNCHVGGDMRPHSSPKGLLWVPFRLPDLIQSPDSDDTHSTMLAPSGERLLDAIEVTACGMNIFLFSPHTGIVTDHPIYITDGQCRVVAIAPCIPLAMQRNGDWSLEDFDLCKELYRGKASILYKVTRSNEKGVVVS